MKPCALLLGVLLLSGCGVKDAVFNLMEGEENSEPPTPLVEFTPRLNVGEVWSESVGAGTKKQFLKLQPIAVDGRIYSADRDGEVDALDSATGKHLWTQDLDVPITGGPGAGESLILVGTVEGEVIALKQEDGTIAWRAGVSSEVLAAPKGAEGVVVVRTLDGKVYGLNAVSGTRVWSYDRQVPVLTLRGTSAPVLVKGLAIVGFDSGNLVALEIESGKVAWEANVAPPRGRSEFERMVDIDAEPLVEGDTLYIAAFQHGVIAVSLSTGRAEWTKDLSSYAGIAVDNDNLYLSDDKGRVWALDRTSGRAVWKQDQLQARAVTAPAVVNDYVVVGDLEGYLHWLNKEDGQFVARVRVDSSALIASPFAVDDTLFAYSSAGTLSAFKPQGGLKAPAEEATAKDDDAKKVDEQESAASERDHEEHQDAESTVKESEVGNQAEAQKTKADGDGAATVDEERTPESANGSNSPADQSSSDAGGASAAKSETMPKPTATPRSRGPRPSMRSSDWLYP